jgi:iron complex transport system ATP-binding protein
MEIAIDNISKKYGERTVLDSISFTVGKAEIVALVGPNGSGKSTLIKTLAGVHAQSAGTIRIDGSDMRTMDPVDLAKTIGYVPQHFTYTLYSTVFETVLLGRRQHIKWAVSDEELSRVQQALDALEMSNLAGSYMDQLSGGERQKVFIARALAQDPLLFLFDEPTSALDIRYQIEVMETMRELTWERGAGMIIAVHDLNLAYRYADSVVVLSGGRIEGYGKPQEVLTPSCINTVYGVDSFVVENENGKFLVPFRAKPAG